MPAGVLAGKGVVEAMLQHVVLDLGFGHCLYGTSLGEGLDSQRVQPLRRRARTCHLDLSRQHRSGHVSAIWLRAE